MADVTFTVDGKQVTAPAGTLLIEACKTAGIDIPAFCYYPGLSLQAACRMCVVRIEKMPKLQTACTTPVAEGMVVATETPEIAQARKATLQLLLGNHPLDCPVCDAGGECELQDMTFKYGAATSFYAEPKNHREEQQWSPVVFFDRPRCILCYRCVRMCGEGMDVFALGIQNRGSSSVIAPNLPASESADDLAHVDCEQCGMCIDACPVGALTSGTYRYKTRPWEMNHAATICTHCGDGCKTTLGVRATADGAEIVRADNRDKSGMNGDFLCSKGRYAFDFANHDDRITTPLVRGANGKLEPVSWEVAISHVGKRLRELRDTRGGESIGVIGGNRLTNEEAYLLQKMARTVLKTNNIDHHRTADHVAFAQALAGQKARTASLRDTLTAKNVLIVGGDPSNQSPATAWNLRSNVRINGAKLYIANTEEIKLRRQAKAFVRLQPFGYGALAAFLAGDDAAGAGAVNDTAALGGFRETLKGAEGLLILMGSELRGNDLKKVVEFGLAIPGAKFALLSDYVNSHGVADMGLLPDMLPGYTPLGSEGFAEYGAPATSGLNMLEIFDAAAAGKLSALYVVGANPVLRYGMEANALKDTFVVVQEMFMTETAVLADVVLPAANLYEKSGSVTNHYGDLQQVNKAGDRAGVRSDFEMMVRISDKMGAHIPTLIPFGKGRSGVRADMGQTRGAQTGEADRHAVWLTANNLEPRLSPFDPFAILDEIQRLVPGYKDVRRLQLLSGNDQHLDVDATLVQVEGVSPRKDLVLPSGDTLFTSGTLGHYSAMLLDLQEFQGRKLPILDQTAARLTRESQDNPDVSHLTDFQTFFLLSVLKIVVVLVITLTAVAYTVLLERKVIGRMQNRWGPSRTGPFGLLQPLADGIKLFLKEDLTPLLVQRPLFLAAPVIALSCALISISVVPFGAVTTFHGVDLFEIANVNIGLLVILGITSIGVYGIALSGWSSNNKYALLGSLRATSQMISYELALGLSLVGVVLRAGSLNLRAIVNSQSAHGALSWNVFGGLQFVAFFIYLMSAYAETNRSPFDLPEAESELTAGYHTEYSSMKFAMFFMAEYANMITVSCVATLMFFGGASSPFGHLTDFGGPLLIGIQSIFWFVLKILAFLFLYIWVRSTLPRFRYDQLMSFGWKFLLPVAIVNIIVTSFIFAFRG